MNDEQQRKRKKRSGLYLQVLEGERKFFEKRGMKRTIDTPWRKQGKAFKGAAQMVDDKLEDEYNED